MTFEEVYTDLDAEFEAVFESATIIEEDPVERLFEGSHARQPLPGRVLGQT